MNEISFFYQRAPRAVPVRVPVGGGRGRGRGGRGGGQGGRAVRAPAAHRGRLGGGRARRAALLHDAPRTHTRAHQGLRQ